MYDPLVGRDSRLGFESTLEGPSALHRDDPRTRDVVHRADHLQLSTRYEIGKHKVEQVLVYRLDPSLADHLTPFFHIRSEDAAEGLGGALVRRRRLSTKI